MRSLLLLAALPVLGQFTPAEQKVQIDSFEKVWTTIRDKHWEKNPGGLDWDAVHREFQPRIEKAQNLDEVRDLLREMLGRLHQTHFAILPATVYQAVNDEAASGEGSTGIDLRVLDGQAVVTSVDPDSPAERAGVKPGWMVMSILGQPFAAAVRQLSADPSVPELKLTRALLAKLSGPVGGKLNLGFDTGGGNLKVVELELARPRGEPSRFGNLPPVPVWFEARHIGDVGYVRFNMFLDLPRVMASFGKAVAACEKCSGFIIDVRGNPGGIGGMAMGMAGYFVEQSGLRLGNLYSRDATLSYVINPRAGAFTGPLAILVDAGSASTAEILAEGLKDLGRARVFGTPTAAAALPSVIEKLPNGDGFQYAIANYISEGGKPLEGLGVKPDVEVKLTRAALLAGHDAVLDAALDWIKRSKK
jgi:carboxyl-terminal processing protease